MKKWEKLPKDELEKIVSESISYGDLAKNLGYTGNTRYDVVKDMVKTLNLDVSHFKNNARTIDYSKFTYGKTLSGTDMLPAIAALRGRKCEMCGLDMWFDSPIRLEVHHKDGDRLNNNLDNLQILCPNCHSMTYNWKARGKKYNQDADYIKDCDIINAIKDSRSVREILLKVGLSDHGANYKRVKKLAEKNEIELPSIINESRYCVDCGKKISKNCTRCQECENLNRKKNGLENRPVTRDELKSLIRTISFTNIGKQFNVSNNTIKKWCIKFNLPSKTKDIKQYSDDEWNSI